MEIHRARRVLAADRRGSSLPVLVETDAGRFVTKLRGAAQGTAALVAEIVVAALADVLELSTPGRVLVVFDDNLPSDDRDAELADLLRASVGVNLGFTLLDGARDVRADDLDAVPSAEACRILWLDGLVSNPDRTARNPNLLLRAKRLWLIDHGAALGFQHDWRTVTEESPRRGFPTLATHVLRAHAHELADWDERLAALIDRDVLRAALAAVPGDFLRPLLPALSGEEALQRRREAYVAFLWKRLRAPRPFVDTEARPER